LIRLPLKEIISITQAECEGEAPEFVQGISKIDQALPGSLTFLSNTKYVDYIQTTDASIILVNKEFNLSPPKGKTLLHVEDAYLAFCSVLNVYFTDSNDRSGIDPTAHIGKSAQVGTDVYIGPNVVIEDHAEIQNGAKIYSGTYIGKNSVIGKDTTLYANVTVYHDSKIGNRCIIHSGTVIGADGFGHAPKKDGTYVKIPQLGNVIIKNDVEIGANSCIDRATLGSTVIHEGVKLDNLIQVAHNAEIGAHTVIASQTGVSGSTSIGAHCMIGGQVGFAGHIKVAAGSKIAAQSGLAKSVEQEGQEWFGSPIVPKKEAFRNLLYINKLSELFQRVKKLEKQQNKEE
jgi:UDP-3-O-[3-hydroxymyristoyl] glucosamine N-acyltransferase